MKITPMWKEVSLPNGLEGVIIPEGGYMPCELSTTFTYINLSDEELKHLKTGFTVIEDEQ